jgi:hypothetical protein
MKAVHLTITDRLTFSQLFIVHTKLITNRESHAKEGINAARQEDVVPNTVRSVSSSSAVLLL